MRFFNTEDPIRRDRHYHIPPLDRVNLDDLLALVRDERYFVLPPLGRPARRRRCWRCATC